jgi:hypothetical protein
MRKEILTISSADPMKLFMCHYRHFNIFAPTREELGLSLIRPGYFIGIK